LPTRTERAIWRPYTQERTAPPPVKLKRAEGAYLITEDGRRIFDGISSWWLITHGHCRPEIAEAVAAQARTLDQAVFANFTHEPAEELAERLLRLNGDRFQHVFFSDNGSTAVEVALKMAVQACAQQAGSAKRNKFLAFEHAYHGDTAGAMSVSARGPFTKPYERMTFEILRAPQPHLALAPVEEWTRGFKVLMERHHHELAAVILEARPA
jgi:adenosylmethionine---8-amino-7-oxononanoate aminotransferase